MPDHRHAARRRHRVVGRLASLGLPLLLVLLELRPALPTAAISSKLPGRRCTALIPHASYSSLEEALAACDVLETCAAVHEEAKQKERARKDPISGKSGSKGYSYAPATYALCSTDSLFLAHWELLPGGRLRAAVHSSAAKPLDPSRVSKEACRILNPQANHTTASATAPALGLMPPSCKAKGASPTDETPTATTADGAPASAYHHRAGGCLERLVTESAARATSDGALCCRDDAHAGHFLDAVRARLGQPEMVEHLWDHIDATLATAPNYVRKILSDLVVLHCYHSCDPANVKPQPGVLTLAASGGAGKGGGRTGGLRDVLADACAQGPQSWKWSARYAFVASSWSEFNAIESASSRDSYRLAGCLDPKRRRFETMGPICYRCGRFVADPRGGGYGGGGGDGDGGGGSGDGGGGSGSGSGSIRASDRNVIQLGAALASAVWPDYDSPGIGKAWSGVNHFPHFFEFAAPAFSFLRWRHALGQDGPQNVIVDGAADFDQNPHHKTGTQWVNTVWATVVRGYDGAAVRRVEPPSSMASTNVDRQSSVGAKVRADADAGAGATTSASANASANSAGSARRLNKSKPKSAGGTKYGISSNGTVIMRNNFFGCDGDDAPHRAPLAGVNSDGRTVCLNGYITGPLGKGTHDSEVQWFFHPLDGLKLAQAIVQHGDYVAAAKGREGESGTGHVQPEQPIITSGPDPKFREFFEEKVQRGPPRIEIVNRKGSRSVPNMGELIDLLTHFDEEKLEELHFEKLAPVDQTRLMTNTDILITPHGAGMVNTFAMPPCGAVIEMFPLGYVLPGLFGNLVAESGKLYYPWFSGTASPRNGHSHSVPTSRVKGVPYEKAKVTTLSRTAQQRSFNISVPEVHTLVLNAIAARAVCLSAAAAPAAEAHPTRIDPVLD